ncbi:penicillin-binding transpeptidase domain-containing protein [Desmospora activa]|uniref:Beta-lactamase n=1 Tax=Desmospora activa DSM 45169 TaxID=1121389 RepID=A0A2T4Z6N0_9BACL|nr:penicillin-binding transpeptidase domain-containing protein [Desmospora activa]PTM57531.1 bla regulator protein BlaR1/beta-lactamase class D [Desmospora activa DSM 45169]
MKKKLIFLSIGLLLWTISFGFTGNQADAKSVKAKHKETVIVNPDLEHYFTDYDGTFLLYDETKGSLEVYNPKKSQKKVSPNSTFKIPNSLIALETGVLPDEHTMWEWDGTVYPFESWNQDHHMRSAIAQSVVWFYQRIAVGVGEERYEQYLDTLSYGNQDISGGLTQFWLQSSLKVSPVEQLQFLRKLYHDQLPFSQRNMDIVRDILILEQTEEYTLSGKTGAGFKQEWEEPVLGWFIGVLEKDGKRYTFVTNIEGEQASSGKAKEITLQILRDKGLY